MQINHNLSSLTEKKVQISCGARLHMGFYDLRHATDGLQRFGSVGLALGQPRLQVEVTSTHEVSDVTAAPLVAHLCEQLQITAPVCVRIVQTIPRHAGLGSGTQLALAVGAGVNQLFNLGLSVSQIAALTNRGARSGIGIGVFERGGFVVDGGRQPQHKVPQILQRLDFPSNWKIILILDDALVGVHGVAEKRAFDELPHVEHDLKQMVMERMLSAVQRRDLPEFGACVAQLQQYNGDYFAPAQGGLYASKRVEQVANWLNARGVGCVGQSSWGPTGFAIVEGAEMAQQLLTALRLNFGNQQSLSFVLTSSSINHD